MKLNERKVFYDYSDGAVILIDQSTGIYYGMNGGSSAVFNELIKNATVDSIVNALRNVEGCPADIEEKIVNFVKELSDKELIIPTEESPVDASPIDPAAVAGEFTFALDEFNELQEILLADPIHDVDVEQGWPVLKEDM